MFFFLSVRVVAYLHEVVGPLHLGHEVLYNLFPDHRVTGSRRSDVVHSNGRLWRPQRWRLMLESIHHLLKTHKTYVQKH